MENHVTNCGENLNLLWKKTIRLQEDRIWRLVERIWREGEIAAGESALRENCGRREKRKSKVARRSGAVPAEERQGRRGKGSRGCLLAGTRLVSLSAGELG